MSDQPIDLSTSELKRILAWELQDFHCTKERVAALMQEILDGRDRSNAMELKYTKALSDMEIRRARSGQIGAPKPKLQDGVRYASPPAPRPMGPDGFPQRGIV
jgi:hypothetical protein